MFKTTWFSLFFVFLCQLAFSQTLTDSLGKVPASQETSFTTFGVNPTKTNTALLQIIKEADTFDKKAKATLELIDFHDENGNIDSVIFYGQKLYDESKSLKVKSYLAKATNSIAIGNRKKGLHDEALKWHIKGLNYAKELGSKNSFNYHKFGIAVVNLQRNKYEEALKLLKETLDVTEDENLKHKIYKRIGDVYLAQNNYKEAKQEYTKAMLYFESVKKIKSHLETKIQLGLIAEKTKHTQQALDYYIFVKEAALKNNFYDLYFNTQNRIGHLYYFQQQYQNAQIVLSAAYINAIQWDFIEQQQTVLNLSLIHI